MEEIMKIKISNTMKFWKMVKFKSMNRNLSWHIKYNIHISNFKVVYYIEV